MDFPYTLVTDWPKHQARQRYLPWINIGIRKPGTIKTVWPLGLVDSRAELTVIDHEIGKELGLNFKKALKNTITGFGGAKVQVLIAEVELMTEGGKNPLFIKTSQVLRRILSQLLTRNKQQYLEQ